VVALRIIAVAGHGSMNPQVLSGPDLSAKIWPKSDPVYDLTATDIGRELRNLLGRY
jgi:hypothetical protein